MQHRATTGSATTWPAQQGNHGTSKILCDFFNLRILLNFKDLLRTSYHTSIRDASGLGSGNGAKRKCAEMGSENFSGECFRENIFRSRGDAARRGCGRKSSLTPDPISSRPHFFHFFHFFQIDQLDTLATLKITIDGTEVFSYAAGAPTQAWAPQTFEIPTAYLDGQSHEVKFNYAKQSAVGAAGAMLDDVRLDCAAQPAGMFPRGGSGVAAIRRVMR
ncbi:MAG: hypothetical protein J0H15_00910 [Xanthomonadales bacterium]|nr:hypothetical protein [Xanthomonadales bacterium]